MHLLMHCFSGYFLDILNNPWVQKNFPLLLSGRLRKMQRTLHKHTYYVSCIKVLGCNRRVYVVYMLIFYCIACINAVGILYSVWPMDFL